MNGRAMPGFPGHPEDEITNAINDVTIRVSDSLRNAGIDLGKPAECYNKKQEDYPTIQ
jgi:hypothetical protein